MKITEQSSLIAAQQLGIQRTHTEAKAASAAFFAELKKSAPAAGSNAIAPQSSPTVQTSLSVPSREAPLRISQPGAPLPPGSLLNIVV